MNSRQNKLHVPPSTSHVPPSTSHLSPLPPPLHYTIGQCLTLDTIPAHREPLAQALDSGALPLDALLPICDRHLILPAVYYSLKRHGLTQFFPPDLCDHLEQLLQASRARNRHIRQQIDGINAALHAQGIAPVYLKGAAHVLQGLYPDPCERIMHDIDFLVPEAQYQTAAQALLAAGYAEFPTLPYQRTDPDTAKHYPALQHPDFPVSIEIHRLPVSPQSDAHFTAEIILSEKEPLPDIPHAFVPSPAHQLIHHVIHSQIANKGYRNKMCSWRDLYDCYRLCQHVAPRNILPGIQKKNQAEAYFLFAAQSLGLGDALFSTQNRVAHRFYRRADRALRHPRRHQLYLSWINLCDLLFRTYLKRILQASYKKSARDYIRNRITDPRWRKQHRQTVHRRLRNRG